MDFSDIKKEFPILLRQVHGHPLAYLDNASTTHKPRVVLEALQTYYATMNANIHRGIHTLSEESTSAYEAVRVKVARFIHAQSHEEIIFTKNCTEGINLVASAWGRTHIHTGDEVIVSALEHHANLVPWQELCRETGALLKVIPLTPDFLLDMDAYAGMLSDKTKLVCVTAQSNVTGTRVPLHKIVELAHERGARVLVDGAQSVGHEKTNVTSLGPDFFAFSAHKMMGPTGLGVIYIQRAVMEEMRPFQFGGDMVTVVRQFDAEYRTGPGKFEAGTPNIADVIAFGAALDFLSAIGMDVIAAHDQELLAYARIRLSALGLPIRFFGPSRCEDAGGVLSFTLEGVHPHDIATILDQDGVAIRSGLHCAEPLVRSLGVPATARMSFYIYSTKEDIDRACSALHKVAAIFKLTASV